MVLRMQKSTPKRTFTLVRLRPSLCENSVVRQIRGSSNPGDLAKIDPGAFWLVDLSSTADSEEFSHNLGRNRPSDDVSLWKPAALTAHRMALS